MVKVSLDWKKLSLLFASDIPLTSVQAQASFEAHDNASLEMKEIPNWVRTERLSKCGYPPKFK